MAGFGWWRMVVTGGLALAGIPAFAQIDLGVVGTPGNAEGYLIDTPSVLAPAGDVNGDAFADFMTGTSVLLGRPGGAKYEFSQFPEALSGYAIGVGDFPAAAGDLDADGFDDLMIVQSGMIRVIYGEPTPPVWIPATPSGSRRRPIPPTPIPFNPVLRRYAFQASSGYVWWPVLGAVGHLDADERADFAFNESGNLARLHLGGACSGQPATGSAPAEWCLPRVATIAPRPELTAPWINGVGGDLDGDGVVDAMQSGFDDLLSSYIFIGYGDPFDAVPQPADIYLPAPSSGTSVSLGSPAGDFDGDGIDDIVVVEYRLDPGKVSLLLIPGGPSLDSVVIDDPDASPVVRRLTVPMNWALRPEESLLPTGIGDFNGDGFGDIAYTGTVLRSDGTRAGMLLHGSANPEVLDEADLDAGIGGEWIEDLASTATLRAAPAGDVDGDGFNDLLFVGGETAVGPGTVYRSKVLFNPYRPASDATYRGRARSGAAPMEKIGGIDGPNGVLPDSRCWIGFDAGSGPQAGGASQVEVEIDRDGSSIGATMFDVHHRFLPVSWKISTDRTGWERMNVRLACSSGDVRGLDASRMLVLHRPEGSTVWSVVEQGVTLRTLAHKVEFSVPTTGTVALAAVPSIEVEIEDPAEDVLLPYETVEVTIAGKATSEFDELKSVEYRVTRDSEPAGPWTQATLDRSNGNWQARIVLPFVDQYVEVRGNGSAGGRSPIVSRKISRANHSPVVSFDGKMTILRFVPGALVYGTATDADSFVASARYRLRPPSAPWGSWQDLPVAPGSGAWSLGELASGTSIEIEACDSDGSCKSALNYVSATFPRQPRGGHLTRWGDYWTTSTLVYGSPNERQAWLGFQHQPLYGWHTLLGRFHGLSHVASPDSLICVNPWGEVWAPMGSGAADDTTAIVARGWGANWSEGSVLLAADIDRSGVDDLLRIGADGSIDAGMNGIEGMQHPISLGIFHIRWNPRDGHWIGVADVNADSADDLVYVDPDGRIEVMVASAGPAFAQPSHWGTWDIRNDWGTPENPFDAWGLVLGDFTGEGLADIACIGPDGCVRVCRSTGNSYSAPKNWGCIGLHAAPYADRGWAVFAAPLGMGSWRHGLLQLDGSGRWWKAESTGAGFLSPQLDDLSYSGAGWAHQPFGPEQVFVPRVR